MVAGTDVPSVRGPRKPFYQKPHCSVCTHSSFTLTAVSLGRHLEPRFTEWETEAQRGTKHSPKAAPG